MGGVAAGRQGHRERGEPYPFPLHPLELGEAARRAPFGFNYEYPDRDDDPDLERITLARLALQPALGR